MQIKLSTEIWPLYGETNIQTLSYAIQLLQLTTNLDYNSVLCHGHDGDQINKM